MTNITMLLFMLSFLSIGTAVYFNNKSVIVSFINWATAGIAFGMAMLILEGVVII